MLIETTVAFGVALIGLLWIFLQSGRSGMLAVGHRTLASVALVFTLAGAVLAWLPELLEGDVFTRAILIGLGLTAGVVAALNTVVFAVRAMRAGAGGRLTCPNCGGALPSEQVDMCPHCWQSLSESAKLDQTGPDTDSAPYAVPESVSLGTAPRWDTPSNPAGAPSSAEETRAGSGAWGSAQTTGRDRTAPGTLAQRAFHEQPGETSREVEGAPEAPAALDEPDHTQSRSEDVPSEAWTRVQPAAEPTPSEREGDAPQPGDDASREQRRAPDSSEDAPRSTEPAPDVSHACLRFESGERRGKQHDLGDETFIGRDPRRCALVLSDEAVSGLHARIRHLQNEYVLVDLASTNGTYVNDEEVERRVLRAGDRIVIGRTEMVFLDPQVKATVMIR